MAGAGKHFYSTRAYSFGRVGIQWSVEGSDDAWLLHRIYLPVAEIPEYAEHKTHVQVESVFDCMSKPIQDTEALWIMDHLSWHGVSDFRQRVLRTLFEQVGVGEQVSYGELAELSGSAGAARAVGTTMANNPFPLLIPCHRVRAANGPGGFAGNCDGGAALKQVLLALEIGSS